MKPISVFDEPGYKAAYDKLQDLQTQLGDSLRQHRELSNQLHATRDIDSEVQAELEGTDITATAVVTRDEIAQLQHRQRVLTEAIARQKKIVECARYDASAEIRKRELPKYRAIIKRMAAVLGALRDIAVEEREFRHAMIEGDVALDNSFKLPFRNNGDAGEPESDGVRYDSIARWEKDAREAGAI